MKLPPVQLGLIPEFLVEQFNDSTHTKLLEKVLLWTAMLRSKGIHKGSTVITLLPADAEWIALDLAIMRCGAIHVPFHNAADVLPAIGFFKEFALIVNPGLVNDTALKGVSFFNSAELSASMKSEWKKQNKLNDAENVTASDTAMIIFTYNSDSRIAPFALSHENLMETAIHSGAALPLIPGDIYLSLLPFSKIYGRVSLLAHQLRGCDIHFGDQMLLPARMIKKSGAASVSVVPSLLQYPIRVDAEMAPYASGHTVTSLHELPAEALKAVFGDPLKVLICGGSMITDSILKKFDNSAIPLMEGYGLTQTSGVFTLNTKSAHCSGSKGKPLDKMEASVLPDSEILAKGIGISPGMVLSNGQLQPVTDAAGWFHTGDEGYIDKDGFVFVTGSKNRVFKLANGYYYDPQPDEKCIAEGLQTPAMLCRDDIGNIHLLLEKNECSDLEKSFLKNFKIRDFAFPLSSVSCLSKLPQKRPYAFSPLTNALYLRS